MTFYIHLPGSLHTVTLYVMITLQGGSTVPVFQKRKQEPWGKWFAHGHTASQCTELLHMLPSDSGACPVPPTCWDGMRELWLTSEVLIKK